MCANSDNMQDLDPCARLLLRQSRCGVVNMSRHRTSIAGIIDWASSALRMHLGVRPTSQIMTISNYALTEQQPKALREFLGIVLFSAWHVQLLLILLLLLLATFERFDCAVLSPSTLTPSITLYHYVK